MNFCSVNNFLKPFKGESRCNLWFAPQQQKLRSFEDQELCFKTMANDIASCPWTMAIVGIRALSLLQFWSQRWSLQGRVSHLKAVQGQLAVSLAMALKQSSWSSKDRNFCCWGANHRVGHKFMTLAEMMNCFMQRRFFRLVHYVFSIHCWPLLLQLSSRILCENHWPPCFDLDVEGHVLIMLSLCLVVTPCLIPQGESKKSPTKSA